MKLALLFIAALGPACAQTVNATNKDIQQGLATPDETGRLRGRNRYNRAPSTFRGTLIDASCSDRSRENLAQKPQAPDLAPAQNQNEAAAKGIQVTPQTIQRERADVMQHQVSDMRARMADATCAVTGNTRMFAVVLDDGRLMNLDEAGNTLALESVQSSPEGRAMLNGTGPALKPKVSVEAITLGDRLMVQNVFR